MELFEVNTETNRIKLSDVVTINSKAVILYLYNKDLLDPQLIRRELSEKFVNYLESQPDKILLNDKNSIDWVGLSNRVKQYKAFSLISENENNKFLEGAREFISSSVDPFMEESKYISPIILKKNIKEWKEKANYIEKLHLQDLLYYYIIDFTSCLENDGTHIAFGSKLEAEKQKFETTFKQDKDVSSLTKELLSLNKSNNTSTSDYNLKNQLKHAKVNIKNVSDADKKFKMKLITKICKTYVSLEKEKIKLYESITNETTYLMCFIRPIFLSLFKAESYLKYLWSESTLKCKKNEENEILLHSDGKSTTSTKIDGILVDEEFDLEVALIEVSGPNWKVNTNHFFEDRKKLAKNMKCMHQAIITLKERPCLISKKNIKIYGFHIYLNVLYVYSLCQPTNDYYIFNHEAKIKLCSKKVVIHSLPGLVSRLWPLRDLIQKQHESISNFLYENEPSPESSCYDSNDNDESYVSPKKKQKVKKNN